MKIKKITFENFRNFKERGYIEFSTDGKATIIYGKNGDGKTTLHQFFQWMFYGETHFNKTATGRLYNLEFEAQAEYSQSFKVYGNVEFEHEGRNYSLTRTNTYRKALNGSPLIAQDLELLMMNENHDWKRIEKPEETIEALLPSGLAEYFFFDGESMIADLRTTGRESADKLRKALYSIFDLDVIESAINHIGKTELKTTVLGKLFGEKGIIYGDESLNKARYELTTAQDKVTSLEDQISTNEDKIKKLKALVNQLSEEIGTTKSKEEYEAERKRLKDSRDLYIKNVEGAQSSFGETVIDMYPKLLLSRAVKDAGDKIHMQVEKYRLPSGINKTLINYLLDERTETCVCGKPLCDEARAHIQEYLNYMPPRSYAQFYTEFIRTAESWGKDYDAEKLSTYIEQVIENRDAAEACDKSIATLDNAEKQSKDISQLVVDRGIAEAKINELNSENTKLHVDLTKYNAFVKKKMQEINDKTESTEQGKLTQHRIDVMIRVLQYFTNELSSAAFKYSQELQTNIQGLVNRMLTSTRNVRVSPEFAVTITDSYKDESKSEGQFAVVSFAYIGGILTMLKGNEKLANKEYPLILDGPFSKLDSDQRQNVADAVPEFAPQVILFSKDDLRDVFSAEKTGRVWTLQSNAEKNVAVVKEGFLW